MGEKKRRTVPLRETYSQAAIHQRWHQEYRQDSWQRAFDDEIYDLLFQVLKPAGAWADVGCGSGERTVQLARRCPAVIGVDISPEILPVAAALAASQGLDRKAEFRCCAVEELSGIKAENVHCRGVLMHVPDWRTALDNLCRIVAPGGCLVLFEGNCRSVEALVVRIAHRLLKRASKLTSSDGGLEFWTESNGVPFVVRMADLNRLERHMASKGFTVVLRRPVQCLDVARFPAALRRAVALLNRAWFRLGLPFGSGTILAARKAGSQPLSA